MNSRDSPQDKWKINRLRQNCFQSQNKKASSKNKAHENGENVSQCIDLVQYSQNTLNLRQHAIQHYRLMDSYCEFARQPAGQINETIASQGDLTTYGREASDGDVQ